MIYTRITGSTGMLGSMVARVWSGTDYTIVSKEALDAENPKFDWYTEGDWVVNCIGKIKPYCDNIPSAIKVNALFPHLLPAKTIQIATDCVFSGNKGKYVESDPHDATDVYGKTKSLGEAPHIKNLRCSIIGPEIKTHTSLWDWLLQQTEVNGFTNHKWNGITTYHYAKIVEGAIHGGVELPPLQHIVPADTVTKAELLRMIAKHNGKKITVNDVEAPEAIDRTLSTHNKAKNRELWRAAGYDKPPTIEEMVEELSKFLR